MHRKQTITIIAWILFAVGAVTVVFSHFIVGNPFELLSFTTAAICLIFLTTVSLAFLQSNEIRIAQWSLLVGTNLAFFITVAADRQAGTQYQGTASGIFVMSAMPLALWGYRATRKALYTFLVTILAIFIIFFVAFPHVPTMDNAPSNPLEFVFRYGLAGIGVLFIHLGNITKED